MSSPDVRLWKKMMYFFSPYEQNFVIKQEEESIEFTWRKSINWKNISSGLLSDKKFYQKLKQVKNLWEEARRLASPQLIENWWYTKLFKRQKLPRVATLFKSPLIEPGIQNPE